MEKQPSSNKTFLKNERKRSITSARAAKKAATDETGVKVGSTLLSVSAEGKPTKVKVLGKKKINLDKVVI